MSDAPSELDRLQRENRYLKERNAQLQSDITSLAAESQRLREELERRHGRTVLQPTNPLSGGQ